MSIIARQGIKFRYKDRVVPDSEFSRALAVILLGEYGRALGLGDPMEPFVHAEVHDFGLRASYSLRWAPIWASAYKDLEGRAFSWTPVIGRVRPRLGEEQLLDAEVTFHLEWLAQDQRPQQELITCPACSGKPLESGHVCNVCLDTGTVEVAHA